MEYQEEDNDIAMVVSDRNFYGDVNRACPWCNGMTLMEDTYGYEKVISCTHCNYSVSKTI